MRIFAGRFDVIFLDQSRVCELVRFFFRLKKRRKKVVGLFDLYKVVVCLTVYKVPKLKFLHFN